MKIISAFFTLSLLLQLILPKVILASATQVELSEELLVSYEFDAENNEIVAVIAFTEPDLPPKKKKLLIELGLGYLFPIGLDIETKMTLLQSANNRQLIAAKLQITSNMRFTTATLNSAGLALHYPVTSFWSIGPIYKLWTHKNYLIDPDDTLYFQGAGLDTDLTLKPFKASDFKISIQGQATINDLGNLNILAFHGGIVLKIPINAKKRSSKK